MPKTWSETMTAYTAEELHDLHPDAFDQARERYAYDGFDLWRTDEAEYDFTDQIIPAVGLTLDDPKRAVFYSVGNYDGTDYAALHATATVADWPTFLLALDGHPDENIAPDATHGARPVHIDKRSAIYRALRNGDAYLYFQGEPGYRDTTRSEAVIEVQGCAGDQSYIDKLESQAVTLADDLTDWIDAVVQNVARRLLEDYEYDTSTEGFLDMADANEWYFDEDGRSVNPPDDALDIDALPC